MEVEETKKCRQCEGVKPLTEYGKASSNEDGKSNRCKPCVKALRPLKPNKQQLTWLSAADREAERKEKRDKEHGYAKFNQVTGRWHIASSADEGYRRLAELNGIPYSKFDIFDRDNWTCQLCNEPIDLNAEYRNEDGSVNTEYKSIDHIIPVSKGGPDTPDNVQAAHLGCNVSKGNRIDDEEAFSRAELVNNLETMK